MYRKQRELIEKILFDYYMISSQREDEVYSPFPFYLEEQSYNKMVQSGEIIDGVVRRVIDEIIKSPEKLKFEIGDFPLKTSILNAGIPLYPFFWARYDGFEREEGGVFFSEFNYDKPCAQREIIVSDMLNPKNNPNIQFTTKFKSTFQQMCSSLKVDKEKLTVAILVDPCHYEELHLAYLYIDILKDLGYEFVIAGGKNFKVQGDKVFAFDKEVHVILRQFPTEYMQEVQDYEEIFRLFKEGKILIINDLRAILAQVKSLFSFLWELVENNNDGFLREEEIKAIEDTIPHTSIFSKDAIPELYKNKDKYVVKAIYGRYSEEVYIGKMNTEEEWVKTIQYVADSPKVHIVQEFCPIKKERVIRFQDGVFKEVDAFANYGVYLINGQYAGTCIRWSDNYLTSDDNVWISPIGITSKSYEIINLAPTHREQIWQQIYEEAAFKYGFVGGHTCSQETFLLQSMLIHKDRFQEIKNATESISKLLKKTTEFVKTNRQLFCPVLGISDRIAELVTQSFTDSLTFVGRYDWAIDTSGSLKLLEFNSETPAGFMEALALQKIIKEKFSLKFHNPNEALSSKIVESFLKIIKDYEKVKEIKNVGIISGTYYEDWYNTTIVYDAVKHLAYNIILGEVSALKVKDEKLYLYGEPLDAVYRYYPLDWFDEDEYFNGVIEALKYNTLSINPPSTFINQSKAFFALVWELVEQGYYSEEERELVKKYIPHTTLTPEKLNTEDYCRKPFFGREGEKVSFSFEDGCAFENINESIFQERVDIQTVNLNVYTTTGESKEILYPIIGAFTAGEDFAGIYTRAAGRVTDKWAVYVPTYVV